MKNAGYLPIVRITEFESPINVVGTCHKCTNWHLNSALYSTQFDSTLTTTVLLLSHVGTPLNAGRFADCSNNVSRTIYKAR